MSAGKLEMMKPPSPLSETGRAAFEMVLCGAYDRQSLFAASGLYFGMSIAGWFGEAAALMVLALVVLMALSAHDYLTLLFCFAFSVPFLWAQFWWAPRKWNSSFLRDPAWHGVREVRVTYQSLFFSTQTRQCEWNWRHFIHWKENESSFMMVLPDCTFEFVPKYLFRSRAELDAFRDVLISSIEIRGYDVYPGSALNIFWRKVYGPNWREED